MTTASLAVHVRVSAPLRQFLRVRSILSIPISALSAVLALAYVPLRLSVWVNQSAVAKRNEVLSNRAAPLFLMPAKRGKNVGSQGKSLRVTGKEPLPFYRLPIRKRSFAYTQTIVRLYANDRVPIRKLKRFQTQRGAILMGRHLLY